MNRKVIKLGNQANVLTLPVQWVRENNVSPGDELDIVATPEKLVVSAKKQKHLHKTFSIELHHNDFNLFRSVLIEAYTLGYDNVIVNTKAKDAKEFLNTITSKYFFGFEVVKQQDAHYEIENISEPENDKFEIIFRKMFILCIEIITQIAEQIPDTSHLMERFEKMEKYNNFCKRSITKRLATIDTEAVPYLWQILSYLTKLKITGRTFAEYRTENNLPLTKETIRILHGLSENLNNVYKSFYTNSPELTNKVHEDNKAILATGIYNLKPKNKKEARLFSYLFEFQRLISYTTAPIVALNIHKCYLKTKLKKEP